ncbi:CDP-diacylglycerol--serine O-phosphatidyltransferase [Clostridium estertheticum]|uniref:CDP-diacylglycerol--serine O-phosphatidyltransferase n=2 Tax=Clostridium estertheticum TaxID=238834 RepID=A0A1J0GMG0_9CLOT|nr:CDP-diacylglycerol--serine O-phosphatidyltransferase [Clostridium estertheticum]APC42541.1 CDP-diacylglycerol--serine O-phosphatidyltransferase [Clostridium estertheticum subsp. estertheticum]MBU3076171.1 CDP-diacylglycerol--serine O-phosphatidyltransferase [Clostridium estertheticum]MBU3166244.1 CDP-diacylglycerol--serine O-phosphatidyltransferase [Clostridium estertheticum]MBU3174326.1 CDP-diacylglycerol--serine O-phosphatidyltransferase [Clostridium estertheticum]MBU3183584.1 CDP-diacylg
MVKIKNAVPNIFTLSNMSCGILSILMSFDSNYKLAAIFILLAGIFDRYDGKIARFLNVDGELGKELDSLCDLVSFGVAPSILIFSIYNFAGLGPIGYLMVLVFPVAGAYRLAKYNITDFDGVFSGIPITVTGTFLALYAFFMFNRASNLGPTMFLMVLLSYLMVSKFKFKKQ